MRVLFLLLFLLGLCGTCCSQSTPNVSTIPPGCNVTTCDYECQVSTCSALVELWRALNGPQWRPPEIPNASVDVQQILQLIEAQHGVNGNLTWPIEDCSLITPESAANVSITPPYCTWLSVYCCSGTLLCDTCTRQNSVAILSGLLNDGLNGTLPIDPLVVLNTYGMTELDLQYDSNLVGSLPTDIGNLTNLRTLRVSGTGLSGKLPPTLSKLTKLRELLLDYNRLTGDVPATLCDPNSTSLQLLSLRSNALNGTASLINCNQLLAVDLANNQLTGPFPDLPATTVVQTLRISNNLFTGNLSETVFSASFLNFLDASNNRLTGPVSPYFVGLYYLTYLYLDNNFFSGQLPGGLFLSPSLSVISISNNNLTGTLPYESSYSLGLSQLVLHNNKLTGTIPNSMSYLPKLTSADFRNNQLHCADCGVDGSNVLPDFLMFDNTTNVARAIKGSANSVNSNSTIVVSCNNVIRRPGFQPRDQGLLFRNVSVIGEDNAALASQLWLLDPTYYNYYTCSCGAGLRPSYDTSNPNLPQLVCTPVASGSKLNPLLSLVLPLALGIPLLLLILGAVVLRKQQMLSLQHYMANARKRMRGVPREGSASVVITDIEGFSTLMKINPEATTKALSLHNGVIHKCKWEHAGHVIEQEGDCFALVFYEAFDAVAFCLQAQQALMKVAWPEGLEGGQPPISVTVEQPQYPSPTEQRGLGTAGIGSAGLPVSTPPAAPADKAKAAPPFLNRLSSLRASSSGTNLLRRLLTFGPSRSSTAAAFSATSSASYGGGLAAGGEPTSQLHPAGSLPPIATTRSSTQSFLTSFLVGNCFTSEELDSSATQLFAGLRVRMGIATGSLDDEKDINSSMIMDRAKVVSDAAIGGEVLMDGTTFDNIKESLLELGAVDSTGINYSILTSHMRQAAAKLQPKGGGGGDAVDTAGGSRGKAQQPSWLREATVLDMGEYLLPVSLPAFGLRQPSADDLTHGSAESLRGDSISSRLRHDTSFFGDQGTVDEASDGTLPSPSPRRGYGTFSIAADRTGSGGVGGGGATASGAPREHQNPDSDSNTTSGSTLTSIVRRQRSGSTATAVPEYTGPRLRGRARGGRPPLFERLRLMQILPFPLLERAKVFGTKLMLDDGTVCWDPPYFDAPGARDASLAQSNYAAALTLTKTPLPLVTLVFCSVDGARSFVRHARPEAANVHRKLLDCLQTQLRCMRGGYMCRHLEANIAFMLAFAFPQDAVEWCLAVQRATMEVSWDSRLLQYTKFAEQRNAAGSKLFRGPRLKMGVCEGVPEYISPDHMGRCDYHGSCVNQAARYMDVAAHGGQIACDLPTAQKVLTAWRAANTVPLSSTGSSAQAASAPATPVQLAGLSGAGSLPMEITFGPNGGAAAASGAGSGSDTGGGRDVPASRGSLDRGPRYSVDRGPRSSTDRGSRNSLDRVNSLPSDGIVRSLPAAMAAAGSDRLTSAIPEESSLSQSGGSGTGGGSRLRASNEQPTELVAAGTSYAHPPLTQDFSRQTHEVHVMHAGLYKFKGNVNAVEMAHISLASLAAREYPPSAPRGKGHRVQVKSGLIGAALVQLAAVSDSSTSGILAAMGAPAGELTLRGDRIGGGRNDGFASGKSSSRSWKLRMRNITLSIRRDNEMDVEPGAVTSGDDATGGGGGSSASASQLLPVARSHSSTSIPSSHNHNHAHNCRYCGRTNLPEWGQGLGSFTQGYSALPSRLGLQPAVAGARPASTERPHDA